MKNALNIIIVLVILQLTMCSSDSWSYDKRGANTMIENLYETGIEDNDELQDLKEAIENLTVENRKASTQLNSFENRFSSFNLAAATHLNQISDSNSRNELLRKLEQFKNSHNQKMEKLKKSHEKMNGLMAEIREEQESLKLFVALKEMEKFEKEDMPDVKRIQDLIKEAEDVNSSFENQIK